ncbi:MAG: hypothetical protein Q9M33_13295 [Robiginitomaculum sp.]|nr:hypothetical protein [Robiginitomaculum sp.]MDQ7078200.1 hypothetical protein [Robiginitomaculum sp.]
MKISIKSICVIVTTMLGGCGATDSGNNTYTLYRNSEILPNARIHYATFDSKEGGKFTPDYNEKNCREAAAIYRKYDPAKKNWWCEKGKFRP